MFSGPDLESSAILNLPKFIYVVDIDDGDNGIKKVPLVCYGKPSNSNNIRDEGVYLVEKLYDVNGRLLGENIEVAIYKPDR